MYLQTVEYFDKVVIDMASGDSGTTTRTAYARAAIEYEQIYGPKTIVAMQLGSMYNFLDEYGKIAERVAGLHFNSQGMAGFPITSMEHWCSKFTDAGYVVVVMNQFSRPKKNGSEEMYRKVVGVYGPGTPFVTNTECDVNVCAVVYLDDQPGTIGYATFQSNTGKTQAGQWIENGFEEAYSGLLGAVVADGPVHTLVITGESESGNERAAEFANKASRSGVFGKRLDYKTVPPITLSDAHVKETISEQFSGDGVFGNRGTAGTALRGRPAAAKAFAHLVHFLFRKDDDLRSSMEPPAVLSPHLNLDVAIGGLRQLDIIKDGGLLDHIPRCVTSAGKRAFRARIARPSRDPNVIVSRLNKVDAALNSCDSIRAILRGCYDIESIVSKMGQPTFRVKMWHDLWASLWALGECASIVGDESHPASAVAAAIDSVVDMPSVKMGKLAFREGTDVFLDERIKQADDIERSINSLLKHLNFCGGAVGDNSFFRLDSSKDGDVVIVTTQKRFDNARKELRRRKGEFKIAGHLVVCEEIASQQLGNSKTNRSLLHPGLTGALGELSEIRKVIEERLSEVHEREASRFRRKYGESVSLFAREIEDLDVAAACAVAANERGFVRPDIVTGKGAFVEARNLRHPIVEDLDLKVPYVGNDITLEETGMLLFGINGSGKSCLMKSIGVAVCMAQAGMYVAADSFRLGPFSRIFTRIWNNDDISQGLSTFTVEMTELGEILRRGDSMSLVLGDELCSGTERVSATSIISAGIERLTEMGCRFLLATHQHDVVGRIPGIDISVKHMSVEYANGELVYDRILKDGVGETHYGVSVCKALGLPRDFLESANKHMRDILGKEPEYLVSRKRSAYNSSVFVGSCKRCGKAAEHVHHREHKVAAAPHVRNAVHNLEALCRECHENHHKAEKSGIVQPTKLVQSTAGVLEVPIDIA